MQADKERRFKSPGVWETEPDRKEWVDAETGYDCLATRGPTGSWCGYVGVKPDHPAYGRSYYKSEYDLDEVESGLAAKLSPVQRQINDISVHGGLTWASQGDEIRTPGLYWFGFDCAHAGDFSPKYDDPSRLGEPTGWGTTNEYRTLDYVIGECASLAKQLAAIASPLVIGR